MKYQKPELLVLDGAEDAILGMQKVPIGDPETADTYTDNAYEIDE